MVYGGIDEQKEAIREKARFLRSAAAMIPKIKPVMEKFDGKCYNCKLDNAIKELTKDDDEIRLYASTSCGGWYEIRSFRRFGNNIETGLLSAYGTKDNRYMTDNKRRIFNSEKRLDAKKAIALLNESYSELMKKAAELDAAADGLEIFLNRIAELKKTLSAVKDSVPYDVLDICGVNRY